MADTQIATRRWKRITAVNFFDWVDQSDGADACWPWLGGHNGLGYGRFTRNAVRLYAHREAYEITYGPFDPELWVLHECDNPPCCNPKHLFLGTRDDNIQDMMAKDRGAFGMRCASAKFTDELVTAAVAAYSAGGVTQQEIADQFGMTRRHVSELIMGKRKNIAGVEASARRRTCTKFSDATIHQVKDAFRNGEGSRAEIAARFGMAYTTVCSVIRGVLRNHESRSRPASPNPPD